MNECWSVDVDELFEFHAILILAGLTLFALVSFFIFCVCVITVCVCAPLFVFLFVFLSEFPRLL